MKYVWTGKGNFKMGHELYGPGGEVSMSQDEFDAQCCEVQALLSPVVEEPKKRSQPKPEKCELPKPKPQSKPKQKKAKAAKSFGFGE